MHIIPYPVVGIPEAGEGRDDGLVDQLDGLVDEAGQGRGGDGRLETPGGRSPSRGRVLRSPVTAVNVLQILALLIIKLNRKKYYHQTIILGMNVNWKKYKMSRLTDLYSPAELHEFLAGAPYPSLGAP